MRMRKVGLGILAALALALPSTGCLMMDQMAEDDGQHEVEYRRELPRVSNTPAEAKKPEAGRGAYGGTD
jgi:hypothetical protein